MFQTFKSIGHEGESSSKHNKDGGMHQGSRERLVNLQAFASSLRLSLVLFGYSDVEGMSNSWLVLQLTYRAYHY